MRIGFHRDIGQKQWFIAIGQLCCFASFYLSTNIMNNQDFLVQLMCPQMCFCVNVSTPMRTLTSNTISIAHDFRGAGTVNPTAAPECTWF